MAPCNNLLSAFFVVLRKTTLELKFNNIFHYSGQVNDMPTAFCSRIMPPGTNATWTKWKILSSGRFRYLLLFCHNSRSKVNFKVKYDFLANEATNKCNTSISFNFD